MKVNYILFGVMIIFLLGNGEPSVPFYTRLAVTTGEAKLSQEFVLTHSLKAFADLPEIQMIFEIPMGIEFVSGLPI